MSCKQVQIPSCIKDGLKALGIKQLNSMQKSLIDLLKTQQSLLFSAKTGSGKTLGFLLPFLIDQKSHSKHRYPKALIVAPTKELAKQTFDVLHTLLHYCNLRTALIYGGEKYHKQHKPHIMGADIVVATPKRLIEMIESGALDLSGIKYAVFDEVDMLSDKGFFPDLQTILSHLGVKTSCVFVTATHAPFVYKQIKKILPSLRLKQFTANDLPDAQVIHHIFAVIETKRFHLIATIIDSFKLQKVIIFAKKHTYVEKINDYLNSNGYQSAILHGKMAQKDRIGTLLRFEKGEINILCSSDVVGRGIDFKDIDGVIHADLPYSKNDYVHRSGRTGRYGKKGDVFVLVTPDEAHKMKEIIRYAKISLQEHILDEFAPKIAKINRTILPRKKTKTTNKNSAPPLKPKRSGKKRKTTKRDGWKKL